MFVLLNTEDLKLKKGRHLSCSTLLCMEMLPLLSTMPDQHLVERSKEKYAVVTYCVTILCVTLHNVALPVQAC